MAAAAAAGAGQGNAAAAAARKPHRFRCAALQQRQTRRSTLRALRPPGPSSRRTAASERAPAAATVQAWNGGPARDPQVPAVDRASDSEAAVCAASAGDHADVQLDSGGGREAVAGRGLDGAAGGVRALLGSPFRGRQPVRDPRQASHHHGQVRLAAARRPCLLFPLALARDHPAALRSARGAVAARPWRFTCPWLRPTARCVCAGTSNWRGESVESPNPCDDSGRECAARRAGHKSGLAGYGSSCCRVGCRARHQEVAYAGCREARVLREAIYVSSGLRRGWFGHTQLDSMKGEYVAHANRTLGDGHGAGTRACARACVCGAHRRVWHYHAMERRGQAGEGPTGSPRRGGVPCACGWPRIHRPADMERDEWWGRGGGGVFDEIVGQPPPP
eukprot:3390012-Prymnesium_polylepis.1